MTIDDALSENFVLVVRDRPIMEVQVLDDSPEQPRLLVQRIVLGIAVFYKAVAFAIRCYLDT